MDPDIDLTDATVLQMRGVITDRLDKERGDGTFTELTPDLKNRYVVRGYEDLDALFSPVPTHIVPDFQSTAISPTFWVWELSNTGVKVVPLLLVYHSPPEA